MRSGRSAGVTMAHHRSAQELEADTSVEGASGRAPPLAHGWAHRLPSGAPPRPSPAMGRAPRRLPQEKPAPPPGGRGGSEATKECLSLKLTSNKFHFLSEENFSDVGGGGGVGTRPRI